MIKVAVIMGKMHAGGKKNLVMEYYRHIDHTKVQFDFICDADSNSIPIEEIELLGGNVYRISPYQNILKNMFDIFRICKNNDYQIMHGYNGTMNIFAMFIGWIAHVPIRINESISMAHSSDKKTIIKNMLKPFSRCFSTHYMSNGETCGCWQFGTKLYHKGDVAVFKTIIDVDKNAFDAAVREATRKEFQLEKHLVVGHIGRLTEQKNTLFLIDIFAEICKRETAAKLLLIGDGKLREEMLNKIQILNLSDKIIYLGKREDIQRFYNAMDCFLLPSLYEGLPVVGIEAQTCGLPVFFSTEVPKESSPCSELGYFIGLDKLATEWAEIIIGNTKKHIGGRRSWCKEVKAAGFDSKIEAQNLMLYYEKIIGSDTL